MRKLTQEIVQEIESTPRKHYRQGHDDCPLDIKYSSSREDIDDKEGRPTIRRRHPRDDLRNLKVKAPKFYGNRNLEKYL